MAGETEPTLFQLSDFFEILSIRIRETRRVATNRCVSATRKTKADNPRSLRLDFGPCSNATVMSITASPTVLRNRSQDTLSDTKYTEAKRTNNKAFRLFHFRTFSAKVYSEKPRIPYIRGPAIFTMVKGSILVTE